MFLRTAISAKSWDLLVMIRQKQSDDLEKSHFFTHKMSHNQNFPEK